MNSEIHVLFDPLKQILDIMLDLELLEEFQVLVLEGLLGVMLFLIRNNDVTLRERSPRPTLAPGASAGESLEFRW
ncbi:MAG TPA: hypothetical protein VFR47_08190 [Anaerolineales bacterium]|nr:hypothetical protein [Anaerolineales bacterium]